MIDEHIRTPVLFRNANGKALAILPTRFPSRADPTLLAFKSENSILFDVDGERFEAKIPDAWLRDGFFREMQTIDVVCGVAGVRDLRLAGSPAENRRRDTVA